MELKGERRIPAALDETWAALNDPSILKGCIAGCESLERTGKDTFVAVVGVKVGPVSARFKGSLRMTDVRPSHGYTMHFDGQGGVAGFGKGSSEVALSPDGTGTRLTYLARASVGGKLAQVGSRLIDAAAAKMADDFFKAFESKLSPPDQREIVAAEAPGPVRHDVRWVLWLGAALAIAALFLLFRA